MGFVSLIKLKRIDSKIIKFNHSSNHLTIQITKYLIIQTLPNCHNYYIGLIIAIKNYEQKKSIL